MMRRRDEKGSVSLELAVLAPGLLLIISVLIFGGRVAIAGQSVQQAAEQAAREASIARTPEAARLAAINGAKASLKEQGLECESTNVNVDTSGFNTNIGEAATVTATITCNVRAGDLLIPGVPGSRKVEATASSAIDSYRERR